MPASRSWLSWHFGILGAITSGAIAPEAANILIATPLPRWITCHETYGGHMANTLGVLTIRDIPGRGCYAIAELQTI